MKVIDSRHEIRTETVEVSFKDGSTATVLKTERIESTDTNPLAIVLATFVIFLIGSYCFVQLLNSQGSKSNEIQSRQFTNQEQIIDTNSP